MKRRVGEGEEKEEEEIKEQKYEEKEIEKETDRKKRKVGVTKRQRREWRKRCGNRWTEWRRKSG